MKWGAGQHVDLNQLLKSHKVKELSDVTEAEGYEVKNLIGNPQKKQAEGVYTALEAFDLVSKLVFNKDELHAVSRVKKYYIYGDSLGMRNFLHSYAKEEGTAALKLGLERVPLAQSGPTVPSKDNPIILEVYEHGLAATQKVMLLSPLYCRCSAVVGWAC